MRIRCDEGNTVKKSKFKETDKIVKIDKIMD